MISSTVFHVLHFREHSSHTPHQGGFLCPRMAKPPWWLLLISYGQTVVVDCGPIFMDRPVSRWLDATTWREETPLWMDVAAMATDARLRRTCNASSRIHGGKTCVWMAEDPKEGKEGRRTTWRARRERGRSLGTVGKTSWCRPG